MSFVSLVCLFVRRTNCFCRSSSFVFSLSFFCGWLMLLVACCLLMLLSKIDFVVKFLFVALPFGVGPGGCVRMSGVVSNHRRMEIQASAPMVTTLRRGKAVMSSSPERKQLGKRNARPLSADVCVCVCVCARGKSIQPEFLVCLSDSTERYSGFGTFLLGTERAESAAAW